MAPKIDDHGDNEVLETGNIYFLYRPRVEEEAPEGLDDVERFYVVLKPDRARSFRLLVLGRKRLPDVEAHERVWGFVDAITGSTDTLEKELGPQEYDTKTRGRRHRPAARPAGEGVYAMVQKGRNMHLAYALELPKRPREVQDALNIEDEGSIVLSVKNPKKGSPRNAGLSDERKAEYPKSLQQEFAGRRFAPSDPRLLDYEGAEFIMIGAREDVSEDLDVSLRPQDESESSADLFRELRLKKERHPVEPLLGGHWD